MCHCRLFSAIARAHFPIPISELQKINDNSRGLSFKNNESRVRYRDSGLMGRGLYANDYLKNSNNNKINQPGVSAQSARPSSSRPPLDRRAPLVACRLSESLTRISNLQRASPCGAVGRSVAAGEAGARYAAGEAGRAFCLFYASHPCKSSILGRANYPSHFTGIR